MDTYAARRKRPQAPQVISGHGVIAPWGSVNSMDWVFRWENLHGRNHRFFASYIWGVPAMFSVYDHHVMCLTPCKPPMTGHGKHIPPIYVWWFLGWFTLVLSTEKINLLRPCSSFATEVMVSESVWSSIYTVNLPRNMSQCITYIHDTPLWSYHEWSMIP